MSNSELSSQIEMALLESPAVGSVLAVRTAGEDLVGIRVSILGAPTVDDYLPIIANLRARIREIAPTADAFIEIDPNGSRMHDVSTEAIVIRAMD